MEHQLATALAGLTTGIYVLTVRADERQHGMSSSCGMPGATSANYDVTSDGQRFLMTLPEETATKPLSIVANWTTGLDRP